MDLEGLTELLRGIKDGSIRCLAIDTPTPSQFAHELLNANPYAYLDEAGLEERRARATSLGRHLPEEPGKIDRAAIAAIRKEIWPDLRDENELHDLLHSLVALPLHTIDREEARHWPIFYERLTQKGRARTFELNGTLCWIATERIPYINDLYYHAQNSVILTPSEQGESKASTARILSESDEISA